MSYGRNLLLAACLVPALACAERTPARGAHDARVRVVDYNPADVVRLATFYGVSTHVQFANGESIKDIAIGDHQAWEVVPRGRHLFIKPKAQKADTNVTVVTDKRVYHLALVVEPRSLQDPGAWRHPNLVFSLSFRYPEDEALALSARADAAERHASAQDVRSRLAEAGSQRHNEDYWLAGSDEISPTSVRDDGRFIYLTFSNNRDMPAVYAVDAQGDESLVNSNVEGNTLVVQRMVRRLTLRKGTAVACLVNKAFDLSAGRDNTSGTISPTVERILRGRQP